MKDNPYVGPRAYQRMERRFFFGRDREARELRSLILSEREVLFYAQSGAGKTSLLNASVIPDLEEEGFCVLPVARVGAEAPPDLVDPAEVKNAFVFGALLSMAGEEADPRPLLGPTLTSYLQEQFPAEEGALGPRPRVLILDQFEEIVTSHRHAWDHAKGFFEQVREALDRLPDLGVVLSMREDHVAALDPFTSWFPRRLRARFRMERLGVKGALDAIREPAAKAGRGFAPGVAEWLVDNLRLIKVPSFGGVQPGEEPDRRAGATPGLGPMQLTGGEAGTVLGPHVEAVQLQVVCYRMWEHLGPDEDTEIRAQDTGDVDEALIDFYETELRAAATKTGVHERHIRRWFDAQLITLLGTRNPVIRGPEKSGGLPTAVADLLRARHLLSVDVRAGAHWYELAHDRLIEPVRESNAAWREANLQPFQHRAAQWEKERRPPGLLLDAGALAQAEGWQAQHSDQLIAEERDFLEASREAQSRAEEWTRQAEPRTNLAEVGWGIIFAAGDDRAHDIQRALGELLTHRRRQAAQRDIRFYREFKGAKGYRPGDTAARFLARHGVGASASSPDKMPYYLLIAGDPQLIPYEFQYGLDVQYAVGRLHFEDLEDYARYARSVVEAERGDFSLPRQAVIFGPQNSENRVMATILDHLLQPVAQRLGQIQPNWTVQPVLREEAVKSRLGELLGGPETPALLFVATYGLGLPNGHPRQFAEQGAVLCQEWPGRDDEAHERLPSSTYFAAADVSDDARLLGLVAFLLTDYSAGTPPLDEYAFLHSQQPQAIAPYPFVASLPQRLLGHPQGGALAVIGHVEQFNTLGFFSHGGHVEEYGVYESTLNRLMAGHTVGSALDLLNQRYAQLSTELAEELQQAVFYGRERERWELNEMMSQIIDARNHIILGDPAVRLPVGTAPIATRRPAIEPVTLEFEPGRPEAPELEAAPTGPKAVTLIFNGINAVTGEYLLPPMTPQEISSYVQGERTARQADGPRDMGRRSSPSTL